MMKLSTVLPYLKKIQKYMNHVKYPWSSADIRIPSLETQEIQIETATWYIISNSFNFF